MKKIIFLSLLFILTGSTLLSAKEKRELPRLLFFYSQSCHACQKTKAEVMPAIERDFFDQIIVEYLDIAEITNYQLLLGLKEKYDFKEEGVPTIFLEGTFIVGYEKIKEGLKKTILDALKKNRIQDLDKLAGKDLVKHFFSFGFLAIILAGLIDGINPCAFTVIVFFISFLAFQGYKRREIVIIGLVFIFAVFITYILIGLGLFRFLYAMEKFYLVTKLVNYSIALLCFALAGFALYDFLVFKKTGKTEGMSLQLPQGVKNRIHSIIGLHYRKTPQDIANKHFLGMVGSAFVTGFLVSLLEAVCTGQVYLPTITFVLKEATLRLRAFGYLLLYNLMFILPLFLVLLFALLGVTSQDFSNLVKRHMLVVKLLLALTFIFLGLMIWVGS